MAIFYLSQSIQNIIISTCNQARRFSETFYLHLLVLNLGIPVRILQLTAHLSSDEPRVLYLVNYVMSCVAARFYRKHEC